MNTKQRIILGTGFFACAVAGAGIEHLRQAISGAAVKDEPEVKETVYVAKTPERTPERDRAAERLRRRIAELEKALAERDAESAQQQVEPPQTEEARDEQQGDRRRQSREERMERMRTEEPERYAEMQERREEFRQRMEQRARDRNEFLSAVDVAGMTPEQRANHDKLVETLAQVNELTAQMMQGGRGEEGDMLRQEMGETIMTLGPLYESERQYLLEATAKSAGYSGDSVQTFTEHIQSIIEHTTMTPGPGFGGRRGERFQR